MLNQRSWAEWIVAVMAVAGFCVSLFTGIRAFYVNEYRIDVLEANVKEVRADTKDIDRNVQRLLGYAIQKGWLQEELNHNKGER